MKMSPHSLPPKVAVEISGACNYSCPACTCGMGQSNRKRPFLDVSDFKRLLDILADDGVHEHELFCIGEPFLNKDVYDIIAESLARQHEISLLTNGSRIDVERLAHFGSKVRLYFSLDSTRYEAYAAYRGASRKEFDRAMDNLRLLRDTDVDVYVSTLVTCNNENHLDEIAEFVCDLGFSHSLSPFHCSTAGVRDAMLPPDVRTRDNDLARRFVLPEEWARFAPVAEGRGYDRYEKNEALGLYEDIRRLKVCGTGLVEPWITTDGNVVPCCFYAYRPQLVFGNLFETGSFQKIWNTKQFERFRLDLLDAPTAANAACRSCACDSLPVPLEMIPEDTPEASFWVDAQGGGAFVLTPASARRLVERCASGQTPHEAAESAVKTSIVYGEFLLKHYSSREALEYYKRSLAKCSDRLSAIPLFLKLADLLGVAGMVDEALLLCEEWVKEFPMDCGLRCAYAEFLLVSGKAEEAELQFTQAGCGGSHEYSRLGLHARILLALNRHGEATGMLEAALLSGEYDDHPRRVNVQVMLALSLVPDDSERAAAEFAKASDLAPGNIYQAMCRARFLVGQGRGAEATAFLESGFNDHPTWLSDFELCKMMVSALVTQGGSEEALAFLDRTDCGVLDSLRTGQETVSPDQVLRGRRVLYILAAPPFAMDAMLHVRRGAKPEFEAALVPSGSKEWEGMDATYRLPEGMYDHESMFCGIDSLLLSDSFDTIILVMNRVDWKYYAEMVKLAMSFRGRVLGFAPELMYDEGPCLLLAMEGS